MTSSSDPFLYHPELRKMISDPGTSFFRDFSVDTLFARFPELEVHRDWPYSDSEREAIRAKALAAHSGDLWVFGYGSLMWDPAFYFTEVRRARVEGFSRRMILMDVRGARGTEDAPGLMAALDHGDICEGLAFRIPAGDIDTETEILWRRELIAPAYIPQFVTAQLDDGPVAALTFLADHAVDDVRSDLTRAEQVRFIAKGSGFLGTSREYLANIVSQFDALGIQDKDCAALLTDVDAYLASLESETTNKTEAEQQ